MGQKVREFVSEYLNAGSHSVAWDGCDGNGIPVSSGIYIARLKAREQIAMQRMLLIK